MSKCQTNVVYAIGKRRTKQIGLFSPINSLQQDWNVPSAAEYLAPLLHAHTGLENTITALSHN